MIRRVLYCLITTVILNNFDVLNASIINENNFNNEQHNEIVQNNIQNNIQNNNQYLNDILPIIKDEARETLKERFEYCTDWLIDLLNSNTIVYKVNSLMGNRNKYHIKNIYKIIDIKNLINEIEIRKDILDDINNKKYLNGNAWSEIPLKIFAYNDDHRRCIGQCLQWHCKLLDHHWDMRFEKNYEKVKLNFYSSYEYQEPKLYSTDILNSEEALSVCLNAIEMDLLTSNHLTSNIELFANWLILKNNSVAKDAVIRYRKYFDNKQNELLANHIMSYYFSFSYKNKMNVARYLTVYYVLNDIYKTVKINKVLECINKYKYNDWYSAFIKNYLDNKFGTSYNKSYLDSFKKVIFEDIQYFNERLIPEFKRYIAIVFRELAQVNRRNADNILKTNKDKNNNKNKNNLEVYKNKNNINEHTIKVLHALTSVSSCYEDKTAFKIIDNIINYLDFKQEVKNIKQEFKPYKKENNNFEQKFKNSKLKNKFYKKKKK